MLHIWKKKVPIRLLEKYYHPKKKKQSKSISLSSLANQLQKTKKLNLILARSNRNNKRNKKY